MDCCCFISKRTKKPDTLRVHIGDNRWRDGNTIIEFTKDELRRDDVYIPIPLWKRETKFKKMKKKPDREMLDAMHRNPGNWRGLFYFNRKDPRLTVPKINGLGWTFNFANPFTYLLLVVIAVLILVVPYLVN